jgi:protein-S-isoprenylcysteine O-methyltransferase Ste14
VVFVFAAFMGVMFYLYVIYQEEPSLKKTFGESYEKYLRSVPRWIPGRTKKMIA